MGDQENPQSDPQQNEDFDALRADLADYSKQTYSNEFLAGYQANEPTAYAKLQDLLAKEESNDELEAALAALDTMLAQYAPESENELKKKPALESPAEAQLKKTTEAYLAKHRYVYGTEYEVKVTKAPTVTEYTSGPPMGGATTVESRAEGGTVEVQFRNKNIGPAADLTLVQDEDGVHFKEKPEMVYTHTSLNVFNGPFDEAFEDLDLLYLALQKVHDGELQSFGKTPFGVTSLGELTFSNTPLSGPATVEKVGSHFIQGDSPMFAALLHDRYSVLKKSLVGPVTLPPEVLASGRAAAPVPAVPEAAAQTAPAVAAAEKKAEVGPMHPDSPEAFALMLLEKGSAEKYTTRSSVAGGTHMELHLPQAWEVEHSRIDHFVGPDGEAVLGVAKPEETVLKLSKNDHGQKAGTEYTRQDDTWKDDAGKRLLVYNGTAFDVLTKPKAVAATEAVAPASAAVDGTKTAEVAAPVVAAVVEAPKKEPTEQDREVETGKAQSLLARYTDLAAKELALMQAEDEAPAAIAALRQKSDKAFFKGGKEKYAKEADALESAQAARAAERETVAKGLEQVAAEIAKLDSSKFTDGSANLSIDLARAGKMVPTLVASLRKEEADLPEAEDIETAIVDASVPAPTPEAVPVAPASKTVESLAVYDPKHPLSEKDKAATLEEATDLVHYIEYLETERAALKVSSEDMALTPDKRALDTRLLADRDRQLTKAHKDLHVELAILDRGLPPAEALALKTAHGLDKAQEAAAAFASIEGSRGVQSVNEGKTTV
jgi:hypothetical protein